MREIFAKGSAAVEYRLRTPSARRRYMMSYENLALKIPDGGLNEQTLLNNGATPRRGMTIERVTQVVGQEVGINLLSANEHVSGLTQGLQRSVKFIK